MFCCYMCSYKSIYKSLQQYGRLRKYVKNVFFRILQAKKLLQLQYILHEMNLPIAD